MPPPLSTEACGQGWPLFWPPWMADMPKMQEHFSAGAWMAPQPENEVIRPSDCGTPKMQEHFSARAWMARQPEDEVIRPSDCGMPKMQEHFSARAWMARHAENAGAISGRAIARLPR